MFPQAFPPIPGPLPHSYAVFEIDKRKVNNRIVWRGFFKSIDKATFEFGAIVRAEDPSHQNFLLAELLPWPPGIMGDSIHQKSSVILASAGRRKNRLMTFCEALQWTARRPKRYVIYVPIFLDSDFV